MNDSSSRIAILLYDGLTALDVVGPYEALNRVPGVEIRLCSKTPGIHRTESGTLGLIADHRLSDMKVADALVIPGGGAKGVSAGIELGLLLAERIAGREIARAVELSMPYDPKPPYGTGCPSKASAETIRIATEDLAR